MQNCIFPILASLSAELYLPDNTFWVYIQLSIQQMEFLLLHIVHSASNNTFLYAILHKWPMIIYHLITIMCLRLNAC